MECGCSFEDTSFLGSSCGYNPNITLFMSLVDLMIRGQCFLSDPCRRSSIERQGQWKHVNEFDFIVVGAGIAGPVVARRLSENWNWNVLLLEAGPEEPSGTSVPAFSVSAVGSDLDWGFVTEPQNTACLERGGVCKWPRGRMIGGTGSMAGLMLMRGNRAIYDSWAEQGNVGWSYNEVLPYFIKFENNKNTENIEEGFHGSTGPMVLQRLSHQPKFVGDLIKAGVEIGYRYGDLNGENQTGITLAEAMVEDGARASTARMYLRPAHKKKNLFIRTNALATRIIIDNISKRAVGVEYLDENGKVREVKAKKEVILSAGAIGSPHLLLLSGIGPREDLEAHGIPVLEDLKVGHNLHNHVSVNVKFLVSEESRNLLNENTLKEYLNNRTGPLSSTGITQVTAFMRSKHADQIPDLQYYFDGLSATCSATGKEEECDDGTLQEKCSDRVISTRPTNVMTLSKGYLTLKSKNPKDYPLIYSNYLTEQRDVDILMDGIKLFMEISKTESLKAWNMRLYPQPEEKCAHLKFASDEYWACVIRTYTLPENHQAGTCKMGPSSKDAVVDPELRVHGITNLRVIDASIFPNCPNSNPIAALIMAAEKGAHMIQSAWKSFQ